MSHDPHSVGAVTPQSVHFDQPLTLKSGAVIHAYDLMY
jgi:homoserine O-acetyltransferase